MNTKSKLRTDATNSSVVIIICFALLLIVAVAFFVNRSNDLGNFQVVILQFATSFSGGKVLTIGILKNQFCAVFIGLGVMLSWIGLGSLLRRIFDLQAADRAFILTIEAALGASIWSLLWFIFGVTNLLKSPVASGLLIAGIGLGIFAIFQYSKINDEVENTEKSLISLVGKAIVGIVIALGLISSLAPITGKDALVYRLAVPQSFVRAGGFVDGETNFLSHVALGAEMNSTWGMLVGNTMNQGVGESAFSLISFAYFLLLLMAAYNVARQLDLGSDWCWIATAVVASIPTMFQVATSCYVDHALALYVLLGAYFIGVWWKSEEGKPLIFAAIFLGGALATKFIAVFAFVAIFVLILLKIREAQKHHSPNANQLFLHGIWMLIAAGFLASPWYFKTWIKTGSPIFPSYAHLWKASAPGWDAERSKLWQYSLSHYGDPQNIFDYLITPIKISTVAQPEVLKKYDGVLGISILVGLPLLIFGLWKLKPDISVKILSGIAAGWYFCWLFSSQQLRFLMPAIPLLTLAIVAVAASIQVRNKFLLQRLILSSVIPGLFVIMVWFFEANPVRAALGGEAREEYLQRRLEFFPFYQAANNLLPADAKIWLINVRNDTVHLERAYFADYFFEDYTISKMVKEAQNVGQLKANIKAMGITHLLVRYDVLTDYKISPLVDEVTKSEAENLAKIRMFNALLTEESKVLKKDARVMLVELN